MPFKVVLNPYPFGFVLIFLPAAKPAAGQVMGPVVVVLLLLLLLFKTFTQYLKVVAAKEARVLERLSRLSSGLDPIISRDPTPKKV